MPDRLDRRTDYRRFPKPYFDLLDAVDELNGELAAKPIRIGPMARKAALPKRRDLYRFKQYLLNADPTDDYARRLGDLFNSITISIEGTDDAAWIVITPEVIGAALSGLRELQSQRGD